MPAAVRFKAIGIGTEVLSDAKLVIRNIGKGSLIGNVNLNQSGSVFGLSNPGPFSIPAHQTMTEDLSCLPNALNEVATIGITSNDPAKGDISVSLKCRGLPGRLSVPRAISIAGAVGSESTKSIKIKNIGHGVLTGFVGSVSSPYLIESGGGQFVLPPKGIQNVVIGFIPNSMGKAPPGLLGITIDSPSVGGNVTVTLRGVGSRIVVPGIQGP